MFRSTHFNGLLNKTLQGLVMAYQVLAVVVLMASLFAANVWLRTPFPGAFVEHTMAFNGIGPARQDPAWQLFREVRLGEQLLSVDGTPVRSWGDLRAALAAHRPGDQVALQVRGLDGSLRTIEITLHEFPDEDRGTYQILPAFISLIFLAIGLWIFGLRRSESAGRAFALFATSLAIISGTLFDLYTTHYFTAIWTLAVGVCGGALFDLALAFPEEARLARRWPPVRWLGYLAALILSAYAFTTLFNLERPTAYFVAWRILYLEVAICGLFFLGMILFHSFAAASPVIRNQARTILAGSALAFLPMILWLTISAVHPLNFSPYLFLFVIAFPLTTGYTILRYRLLRTDTLVSLGLTYALLTLMAAGSYALLLAGVSLLLGQMVPANNPLLIGAMVLLLALGLEPLRARLQRGINRALFRGEQAYQERLQQFSHELTEAVDLAQIARVVRRTIHEVITPERLHFYIYDPLSDQYSAMPGEDGRPTSDVRFPVNSPLVERLQRDRLPLYQTDPSALRGDQSRLIMLGAQLFIPLPGKDRLAGWLALGPRRSGEPYRTTNLAFLESLANQAAVALSRAQTIFNLEQRVSEMNVLARVTQGVNVTPGLDDALELIYAQTAQVVPLTDFHITLYNQTGNFYYYAFCLEQGDRLNERENVPLPADQGLSPEVIRRGRPILTADYARECQARNVSPAIPGLYAWMGVPLNAGADTIGAVSVGSRDPSVSFTRGQLNLLQSIADQTAGAIVKARLLAETERRAFQLETLNQITRQLTSTLELEPLLQNILESAIGILNCEAGSLFLVDEQTDEIIFKVAISPVASDLVGKRLPPGSGIVGRAIATRAPVIVNDAQRDPQWNPDPDRSTGFVTRALLAVPMQVKDRVIGVIEVINRRDGLPFVADDQSLLTAFAGQAAVAIENARLYTLTDQELATRVEELSVMQRIDRELNASLEVERAMRITLEWAMRQSRASAGLIGAVEENGLRVMAQQGYGEEAAFGPDARLPLDIPAMRAALESAQARRLTVEPGTPGAYLPGVRSQIVVPIRREASVIGVMLLESTEESDADLTFLSRLSDHAAIAISNAQLYAAVQAANLAKSEFVSFVAHELKNPMTSIKGYTELLASGAVGKVTEMQASFLATIRANVERMATLVSDLNDNSKIEAGRLRLDFKATDLVEAVEEVVRSTQRQIEDKKQTLRLALAAGLPKVWADRVRLVQILTNLVSNAHKYTPAEGEILIGAEAGENQWDPQGPPRVVHVWVRDNGIGISLEDQRKIFQKFFRSEDSKAREAPGTGLGLNITRSLVEMQGGRIWFESEFRKGTTFHFTIPVSEG